jgi:hypothetical protein
MSTRAFLQGSTKIGRITALKRGFDLTKLQASSRFVMPETLFVTGSSTLYEVARLSLYRSPEGVVA